MRFPSELTLALALALAAALGGAAAARAQTAPLYTANTTTAAVEPGAVHFLQVVDLAQGPGTYRLDTLTISFNFTTADPQSIVLEFYTGVDPDPNSPNVLANATYLGSYASDDNPPNVGNYAFTYSPPGPFTFTTSNGALAVEVVLTTTSTGNYTTTQNGRFTASAPTLGTSPGYVWNDANLDNIFTGAEQTKFGMANANARLALTGTQIGIKSITRQGAVATVTVDSYTGHTYQLQRSPSLPAVWSNVGDPQAGTMNTVLTFTDNDAADPRAFYRIVDTLPKNTTGRPAGRGPLRGQQISSIPRLKLSTIRAD